MIFSMDEIGLENNEKISGLKNESEKWAFITKTARAYCFEGIHITPSLYKSFGLDTNNIPISINEFHLTYHFGGLVNVSTESECSKYEKELDNAFNIAIRHDMKDISLHPPVIEGFTNDEKLKSSELFSEIIRKWSAYAKEKNITLSLETHLYEPSFLFGSYEHYINFCNGQKNMGILIDVSHNYFSGYNEQDIIDTFRNKNVTALHISDALRLKDEDIRIGTHLAIGDGQIDFDKLLSHFKNDNIFVVLEIKSSNAKLKSSLEQLKNYTAV